MRIKRNYFSLFAIISLGLIACTDDYFEFDKINLDEWSPELALPLVNSTLTIDDIVLNSDTNGAVNPDPNSQVMELVYDGRVFSTPGAGIISLPSQSFNESFQSPNPLPTNGGSTTLNFNTSINFDNGGTSLEVDSLLMKNGQLVLNLNNTFEHDLEVTATLPSFKNSSGQPLSLNYIIPRSTGSPQIRSQIIELNGYTLGMTGRSGNTVNSIPIDLEVKFNLVAGNSSNSNDELSFDGVLRNLAFKEFYGYAGQNSLQLDDDTINISIFRNFINGTFFLSNPQLDITIQNSFGVPTNLTFNRLKALNDDPPAGYNSDSIDIRLPPSARPISLNSPMKYGADTTGIRLRNNNSNIDTVVSYLLKSIVYDANAQFNPAADRTQRNFITDTSKIGIDVFLRLPFEGYASGFTLSDTIDFSFDNTDDVESGIIRTRVTNGFPIAGQLQVVFVDSLYNPIDSLFTADPANGIPAGPREVISAAPVDNNGDAIGTIFTTTDGEISKDRFAKLNQAKFAVVRAILNTTDANNQQTVRFKSGYEIQVSLGIKATITIN